MRSKHRDESNFRFNIQVWPLFISRGKKSSRQKGPLSSQHQTASGEHVSEVAALTQQGRLRFYIRDERIRDLTVDVMREEVVFAPFCPLFVSVIFQSKISNKHLLVSAAWMEFSTILGHFRDKDQPGKRSTHQSKYSHSNNRHIFNFRPYRK